MVVSVVAIRAVLLYNNSVASVGISVSVPIYPLCPPDPLGLEDLVCFLPSLSSLWSERSLDGSRASGACLVACSRGRVRSSGAWLFLISHYRIALEGVAMALIDNRNNGVREGLVFLRK